MFYNLTKMKYLITISLVIFYLLQTAESASVGKKFNTEPGPNDYELYEEVIYQPALKNKVAITEVEWQGQIGTIISAINIQPSAGVLDRTEILEGGVGEDFVKLIIKSEIGKGNEYVVKIFGRN